MLAAAGPAGASGSLCVRAYDATATIGGRGGNLTFDLATATPSDPGPLAAVFLTSRRLHETLLLDLGWLVTASTVALLALVPLGLLLGWPRLRNTVSGWHRLTGWILLPLILGSLLTGLALALGITLSTPAFPAAGGALPMLDTLRLVALRHDLNGLDFVRTVSGGARLVRVLDETGTAVAYRVTADGLVPQASNWPRLLHEGNWAGVLGSLANLIAGVGLAVLLATGLYLWTSRTLRRRSAKAGREARVIATPTR